MEMIPSPMEPPLTSAKNSASAELSVCIACVAELARTKCRPANAKHDDVDFRVSGQPAKLESVHTLTSAMLLCSTKL
eukprot:5221888-Amphidinium_carterae.3